MIRINSELRLCFAFFIAAGCNTIDNMKMKGEEPDPCKEDDLYTGIDRDSQSDLDQSSLGDNLDNRKSDFDENETLLNHIDLTATQF